MQPRCQQMATPACLLFIQGEGEKGSDGPAGNNDGVNRDDQYDYDDDFIDDSEFKDYYGGDRRKAKHDGFFINSGEIEKVLHLLNRRTNSYRCIERSGPSCRNLLVLSQIEQGNLCVGYRMASHMLGQMLYFHVCRQASW